MNETLKQLSVEWDHKLEKLTKSNLLELLRRKYSSRLDVHKIVAQLIEKAKYKLDDRVVDFAEQIVIDALEKINADHNKAFINGTVSSVLNALLISIMDDYSGIRESFGEATTQVATASRSVTTNAAERVKSLSVMAAILKFAADTVRKEIDEMVKNLFLSHFSLTI